MNELFTASKQSVRNLNYKLIQRHFKDRNDLVYMGLPSSEMKDVLQWAQILRKVYAIEMGKAGQEYLRQHNLLVTAAKNNLLDKLILLRGDVDTIIADKTDAYGNRLEYPFDIVNLDYCSGIVYKPESGFKAQRIEAFKKLFDYQAEFGKDFLLLITVNLKHDSMEVTNTLKELMRHISNVDAFEQIKNHPREEVRLKVYVPYVITRYAALFNYKATVNKPIHYEGNKNTKMMHFSFYLEHDDKTYAPKMASSIINIVNKPMLQVADGQIIDSDIPVPVIE